MRYAMLVLGCLGWPMTVRAQGQGPDLTSGTRVRITARAMGLEQARGTLSAISGDTVVVAMRWATMAHGWPVVHDTLLRMPVGEVERLEVRHRAPFNWTGAGLGGVLGGVLTAPSGPAGLLFGVPFGVVIGGGGKHAFKTGAIGAAVAALPFAILTALTFDESRGGVYIGPSSSGEAFVWGAMGGGMLGFMVGGVIGSLSRGEWQPVSLGGDRMVALTPTIGPRAVGVAASVSF
jgi:hypothetical protein